jgi:sigma-E factor negative regulatory protein RseB
VRTEGMHWVRQGPSIDSASAALADYRASQLPPGFRLTVQGAQTLGGASAPASHLVYSDGLATVSVFVEEQPGSALGAKPGVASAGTAGADTPSVSLEPDAQAPVQGLARVGSGYAFSTVVQGHQVTAVGEVPAQTVEFIAHSVKIYGGAEIPRR